MKPVRTSNALHVSFEHSTTVTVVEIRSVISKLSICLAFLLLALFFVVAKFSAVPTFNRGITIAWSGVMTPPSTGLSRTIPIHLPLVGVTLLGLSTITAFHGQNFFYHPIESKGYDYLVCCSIVGRDFLRPAIWIEDRRMRRGSPSPGWPI